MMNEPSTGEPVGDPTMAQVAAGDSVVTPEPTPKLPAVEPIKGDPPAPVDTPSDPAQDAVQKRINKITADKYAEKRRADDLQAKLDAQVETKPKLPADAPQLEDFDYDDSKHQAAIIQYEVKKALDSAQQVTNQQQAEQARQKLANDFTSKEAEYLATHPEYSEEVGNLPMFNQDTLNAIYELGPQVTHYLAKHLDVANEVASASTTMAAIKLGQISMGLTADTKTVTTTKAPEPVETIAGAGGINKSQEDMSMDEIMAL
ncbi:hypothetical protein KAR91_03270 [Candidatus Pacearchaeota archaeon]|nr:hypothetical protein [Candidatus Pacearchaeota archaeon]